MFFHVKRLSKNLQIEPKYYGPSLAVVIKQRLQDEVDLVLLLVTLTVCL